MATLNRECYLTYKFFGWNPEVDCFILKTIAKDDNKVSKEWSGFTKTFEKVLKIDTKQLKDDIKASV